MDEKSEGIPSDKSIQSTTKGIIRFNSDKQKYELAASVGSHTLVSSRYKDYLQRLIVEQKHPKVKGFILHQVEVVSDAPKIGLWAGPAAGTEGLDIPVFTELTFEELKVKTPSYVAWLLGEQYVPKTTEEKPRKRGRPQKHHLPPTPSGVNVNKLSDEVPECNPLSKPLTERLIKEFVSIPGTVGEKIDELQKMFKLPYKQIYKALEPSL